MHLILVSGMSKSLPTFMKILVIPIASWQTNTGEAVKYGHIQKSNKINSMKLTLNYLDFLKFRQSNYMLKWTRQEVTYVSVHQLNSSANNLSYIWCVWV